MSNACHDAESLTRMCHAIDEAACSVRVGAYIKKTTAVTTTRKQTMQKTNKIMKWAKRGVGLNRAGAFFVRKIQNVATNQMTAVKE